MTPTWEAARSTLTRRVRKLKVGVADSHADPKAAGASDGSPAGRLYRPASAIVAFRFGAVQRAPCAKT